MSTFALLAACGGGGGGGGGNDPPAPPATNAPPTVNAGADTTATLPNATVSLSGSATDDGPASALTYKWTGTGPAAVAFATDTAAATTATFTVAGPYTLTLTVNDGTQSASDSITVTVSDATASDVFPADDDDSDTVLHGWAKVEASAVGMNQDRLLDAERASKAVPAGTALGNGMIVRHGKLVHFWGDIDQNRDVKSVTKSMGGVVLGLTIMSGKIAADLSETAISKVPTFGLPPDVNDTLGRERITIAQLATHSAGFPKGGNFRALVYEPGTTWAYSDGSLNWLADVLTDVNVQDLATLANEGVWSKIGLRVPDDVDWRPSLNRPDPRPQNPTIPYRELASGINTNVNAMARVGLLFLREGMWNGQQVLSKEFVTQVHTPLPQNAGLAQPVAEKPRYPNAPTDYGVLWWTNRSKQMANVPDDTYWAWGLGESLIVVIPSLDLVIARNGGQAPLSEVNGTRVWNDATDDWDGQVKVLEPFLDPIVAGTTP
ncbi:MAG TPA: serine hydrolase [Steroidobacteraceae bacterium]|nr:serine hydrolase [Steroidobacteraceae bacterium]